MQHSFTKFVGAAVIVLALASASFAQENTDNIIRPLTKSGSAAFIFTLGGFGTFGVAAPAIGSVSAGSGAAGFSATAAGAGMKYFLSDDMALRVLLSIANSGSGADSILPGKISTTTIGIGAGLEMHFRPLYSTSPFVGAQVGFVTGSQTHTNKVAGTDQDTKVSGSQFNVGVFAGFDWFFTRGMAIGAQYQLGFSSNSSSTTVPNGTGSTTTDAPSSTAIGLGLVSGASVHAVVYF